MTDRGHRRQGTCVCVLLLLTCLLVTKLPGLDVSGIRNGTVDMAEMQRRYAAGERACGLALACGHAYGAGVPLDEKACDSLLNELSKTNDFDTLLGDGQSDASGFIDYARSSALRRRGWQTPESIRHLQSAADKGFAMAMHDLALFQRIGSSRGATLNAEASRNRLEAAGRAGSVMALRDLRWRFLHDLNEHDHAEARRRCTVLAEPLLRKSLSETAHENNLAVAELAFEFALYRLSHEIRVAAVDSGLSEERCQLQASIRQLALLDKLEKERVRAETRPKPAPLQPDLQPDEHAMIATPMGSGWAADMARFRAEELRDVSQRQGKRGAWGDRCDYVIDLAARYMSGVIGFPTKSLLRTKISELIKAGCEDPVVWYLAASLFEEDWQIPEDRLVRICEDLKALDAPLHLRLDCLEMLCWRLLLGKPVAERQQRGERFLQILITEAVQALQRPMHSRQERTLQARVLTVAHRTFVIQDWHLRYFAALKEAIAADAAAPTIDPWLRDLVAGTILLCEGWKVRGTGYASSVSDGQWKIFHEHLSRSRTLLEQAYATDPSLPDAAIFRMTVAMGTSEGHPAVMAWLDKAITAAPEHRDAYRMAMEASRKRWHGSPAAIVDIGRRGVATDAYHTSAPFTFLKALAFAAKDADGDEVGFGKPYWPEARTVLQTYIERTEDPLLKRWHQTALAAYAYHFGHADEVQDLLRGPLRGQVITALAEEILPDWYVRDQMLAAAGQE